MSEVDLALVRLQGDILGKASCNAAFSGLSRASLEPILRPFPGFLRAPRPDALLPARAGGLLKCSPLSCPVRGARGVGEQTCRFRFKRARCGTLLQSPGYCTIGARCPGRADKLHYSGEQTRRRRQQCCLPWLRKECNGAPNRTPCCYRDKQHLSSTKQEFLGS